MGQLEYAHLEYEVAICNDRYLRRRQGDGLAAGVDRLAQRGEQAHALCVDARRPVRPPWKKGGGGDEISPKATGLSPAPAPATTITNTIN